MPELAESMRVLRVHGGKPKYFHAVIGGNFRIDELQAAVLRVKLKYLDGWTAGAAAQCRLSTTRRSRARRSAAASDHAARDAAAGRHIFNQYVVRAERRDALQSILDRARSIGTEIYYPVPLHLQQCFAYLGYARGDFPESGARGRRDPGAADLSGARPKPAGRTWSRASPSSTRPRARGAAARAPQLSSS